MYACEEIVFHTSQYQMFITVLYTVSVFDNQCLMLLWFFICQIPKQNFQLWSVEKNQKVKFQKIKINTWTALLKTVPTSEANFFIFLLQIRLQWVFALSFWTCGWCVRMKSILTDRSLPCYTGKIYKHKTFIK